MGTATTTQNTQPLIIDEVKLGFHLPTLHPLKAMFTIGIDLLDK